MIRPFDYGPAPDGWEATQLRAIARRRKEVNRPELPLLSVNLPYGVVVRQEGDGRPPPSDDLTGYQVVRPGDLVMNQLGKPHGALGVSAYLGIISPAYFVAEIGERADPRYVHHLLRTRLYISEYERRGKFMPPSQFDISWELFRSIPVMLPPLTEQIEISRHLDRELPRLDNQLAHARRIAELLNEFERAWTAHLLRTREITVADLYGSLASCLADSDVVTGVDKPLRDVAVDGSRAADECVLTGLVEFLREPVNRRIDLLAERRQSIALKAVTGGLSPAESAA